MAMSREQVKKYQDMAYSYLQKAQIVLTEEERQNIEIADFGLGEFEQSGLAVVVYFNDEKYCAKELILLPKQTCPQHIHPPVSDLDYIGKQETFRCRWGTVYLYVEGQAAETPIASPPPHRKNSYSVWHEIILNAGEQYTIPPQTWHWFQGGSQGAVVSEFSTRSLDEHDLFTDEQIQRIPQIID